MALFKIHKMLFAALLLISLKTFRCLARIPDDPKPINIYYDPNTYAVFQAAALEGSMEEDTPLLHSLEGIQKIDRNFYIFAREHIFVVDADCEKCSNNLIPYKQDEKWASSAEDTSLCRRKGKNETVCKNFIKVFQRETNSKSPSNEQVFVCGTNSFQPKCRIYEISSTGNLVKEGEILSGLLMCPYRPHESSASFIADENLYTATNGDFGGHDPVILRSPRSSNSLVRLRTTKFEDAMLNDPNFLRFVDGGNNLNKIFVFLTEWAIEDDLQVVYSRVGQICKNDNGGQSLMRREFTSFFKARLNCSLPGQPPFYFNEMQDVTDVVVLDPWYGYGNKRMVFAIMNTPRNSVPASAVCVFTIEDISRAMNGPFLEKYKREGSEKVYWEKQEIYPEPHLSRCDSDPRQLEHEDLNFVRKHPLMHDSVPAWNMKEDVSVNSSPLFTRTTSRTFLTTLAVDTNAGLTSLYTVLLMGTEDGKVLKNVLLKNGQSVMVEERLVFNTNCENTSKVVKKILVDETSGYMMVAFDSCVVRVPLCSLTKSVCKKECIGSRDPYCAWNGESCVMVDQEYIGNNRSMENQLTQDVEKGNTKGMADCPIYGSAGAPSENKKASSAPINITSTTLLAGPVVPSTPQDSLMTSEVSTVMVVSISLAALLLGFTCGFLVHRYHQRKKLSSVKKNYNTSNGKVTANNIYESEKLVGVRRYSNQSTKSKQRNTSTSSQHNSNSRHSSNEEHKRKRTETENSHNSKSDEEGVFAHSSDPTNSSQLPEEVADGPQRNQLHSTSGSTNGKTQSRNSKQSSGSSNENVEKLQQQHSPQKQSVPLSPHDPRNPRYEPVYLDERGVVRQLPYVNGVLPDPNQVHSLNHKVNRAPPNRSMSFQDRQVPPMMQSRAYSIGNQGANTVGHPPRGINRQFSLQMPDNRNPMFASNPRYYSPQGKPPNWQPHFQGDPNVTPMKHMDNRKPEMTHSLDRRSRKAQNAQLSIAEPLDGNLQLAHPNSISSRKRYASESEKLLRHPSSRPPQCQAIDEEQDPPLSHPDARPDRQQTMRENLCLDLQPRGFPENGMINDPAIGRIMNGAQPHSNPGSPGVVSRPTEFFMPVQKQNYHMVPHPGFAEKMRQNSQESASSPTKSNPSTPMQDGRLPSFPDADRRRNYSGPNYAMIQPSSPLNPAPPHLIHSNPQNGPYPMRSRNHSGGNRPQMMQAVDMMYTDSFSTPATPKSQFPPTQTSVTSPT